MIFSCQNPFGGTLRGEAYFEKVESPKIGGRPIREDGIGCLCVKVDNLAVDNFKPILEWVLNYREYTRDPNINQFQYGKLIDGIKQKLVTQCNPVEMNTFNNGDNTLNVTVKLDWKNCFELDENGKVKI